MELKIDRKYKKQSYTISNLYIDGEWFCNVLEDADRGLISTMTLDQIRRIKKPNMTAIPSGTYNITLDVYSPKFGNRAFYKEVCNGKVPRLLNVKGFDGILIHAGNDSNDTSGCLLVGVNKQVGKVLNSQDTFRRLYSKLKSAKDRGDDILITIV